MPEARNSVIRALTLYDQGFDFGDALHLTSSGGADRFATFDQPFAKGASGLEEEPVVVLLQGTDV